MNKVNPMTLGRTQLIEALRSHIGPKKYQEATYLSTAHLRGMLAYVQSDPAERVKPYGMYQPVLGVHPTMIIIEEIEDKERVPDARMPLRRSFDIPQKK